MSSPRRKGPTRPGFSWASFRAEWVLWFEAKKPVLSFGLKFGLLIVLLYALLATTFFDRWLYAYLEANAWLANGILHVQGQDSHLSGVTITSPHFSMAIRRGCDAVEPTWLFCAAVLAFPAALVKKLWGILAGIVVLQLLNLVRILTLYWIGAHLTGFFNTAHLELWPVVFILVAILLFVGWRRWSVSSRELHAA